jgi:NADH:ubiquinone oxidoreductase subunit B-like Fe-S oxidoreductase
MFFRAKSKNKKEISAPAQPSLKGGRGVSKWAVKRSLTLMVLNPHSCCTGHLIDLKVGQSNQITTTITQNPGKANVLILCGNVTCRMAPVIRHLYEHMEKPNWVIALGSCASGGGLLHYSYPVVREVRHIVPVDVFVPGCPVSRRGLRDALDKIVQKASREGDYVLRKQ